MEELDLLKLMADQDLPMATPTMLQALEASTQLDRHLPLEPPTTLKMSAMTLTAPQDHQELSTRVLCLPLHHTLKVKALEVLAILTSNQPLSNNNQ